MGPYWPISRAHKKLWDGYGVWWGSSLWADGPRPMVCCAICDQVMFVCIFLFCTGFICFSVCCCFVCWVLPYSVLFDFKLFYCVVWYVFLLFTLLPVMIFAVMLYSFVLFAFLLCSFLFFLQRSLLQASTQRNDDRSFLSLLLQSASRYWATKDRCKSFITKCDPSVKRP